GVLLGLVIGVLPGLGGTSGVAILLPISVVVARGDIAGANSTTAVILLAGIYWGALFGGVITSILFNIPGEPWSVVLLFDGFPLAKRKGKPGLALTSSFVSSFVGALIATLLFTFLAKEISDRALAFGPPELFGVFVLSFATLIGLGAESPLKSIAMLALGLLLAAVGFDTITGAQRLNFGSIELLAGIGFVPVTIGLFGIGEILASAEEQGIGYMEQISAKLGLKDLIESLRALRERWWLVLSNSVIGFFFGVLPGHGATAASFLGYGLARQYAKNMEDFGKGEISGIMGPQCTADAAGVASLVPLITSLLDVSITIMFGLIGYWLRKMKYPLAPLVVALVLGDSTERELRKSLIAGAGNPGIFFSSPLSAVIMILAVVLLLYPLIK